MVKSSNNEESEPKGENHLGRTAPTGGLTTGSPGDRAESSVLLDPGSVLLEKFKIIELLGQGGMGSVYRVEHLLMNRQFALKCLNKFQAADSGWRRFQNEAKAAQMLDHANLIKVYEVGLLPGGQPFFQMELVEGVTLADEIKRLGRLPVDRAIKIFIQVAFAIGYAHESGVVHRDLKPSNIMLMNGKSEGDQDIVKLVDFGIAKLTGVDEFNQQTLTKTGEIFGSPLYMSPEQCMGVSVDHRSDLYSLGCVFFEALTSAPPFIGETALSTMMKHQSEGQGTLKEASLGIEYPSGLELIISKLLEKDPQSRYQSAGVLASDLIKVESSLQDFKNQSQISSSAYSAVRALHADTDFGKRKVLSKTRNMRLPEIVVVSAATFLLGFIACFFLMQPNTSTKQRQSVLSQEIPQKKVDIDPNYEKAILKSEVWSHIKGDKRVFAFPSTSLGKIELADGESFDASGSFSVPNSQSIGLVASEFLVRRPELMAGFKPAELSVLDLNASKVTSPALFAQVGGLTGLKGLNLYDTATDDANLGALGELKNLLYLNVAFTAVSAKEILKFPALSNLNCLDITCVEGGKKLIHRLPQLPKLRHLLIVKCYLVDDDMKDLAKSDHLKILDVAWNKITDSGVAHLAKLKKLEYLDLSETSVTPEVWKSLVQMTNLRKVKLAKFIPPSWSPQVRKLFEERMAKHAPKVEIIWQYENNLDFIVASTDLSWKGAGMKAHKCPIVTAFTDVGSLPGDGLNTAK